MFSDAYMLGMAFLDRARPCSEKPFPAFLKGIVWKGTQSRLNGLKSLASSLSVFPILDHPASSFMVYYYLFAAVFGVFLSFCMGY